MPQQAGSKPWKFTVWGSRGSVPVSTPEIASYGGQTTCHELELPDARIIIDAGSGLVELGRKLAEDNRDTLLLFTHVHWDHIVGFPFFAPLFRPGWKLDVRGVPRTGSSVLDAVCRLNRPPIFPIDLRAAIRADVASHDLPEAGQLHFRDVRIEWTEVHHPGGCSAFAIFVGDQKIVFTGDVEIPAGDRHALVGFCKDADVLICDAQYRPDEYARHRGWGHSTNLDAAGLAVDAGVGRLILTHHDPSHEDAVIDAMVDEARTVFAETDGARNRMIVATGA